MEEKLKSFFAPSIREELEREREDLGRVIPLKEKARARGELDAP